MADPVTLFSTAVAVSVANQVISAISSLPVTPEITATQRLIPESAQTGILTQLSVNSAVISGETYALAPGLTIRNEMNMLVLPNMVESSGKIRYQLDLLGLVSRIWILNAAEVAALPD